MRTLANDLSKQVGKAVELAGWLHKKRALGGITFILLRDRSGLAQIKVEDAKEAEKLRALQIGTVLKVTGKATKDARAPAGVEVHKPKLEVLVPVTQEPPVEIDKPLSHQPEHLNTLLENRVVGLRNLREAAIFKIQASVTAGLREYFISNGFTEVHTPKLVAAATEGGAEAFKLDYFGQEATLAQSPQFYKQMLVGPFERVWEIAPVYRAEPSATTRHMTEYTSVDAEMGFITIDDLQTTLSELLNYVVDYAWASRKAELESLQAVKPVLPKTIPALSISKIHELYTKATGTKTVGEDDLRPDEERWICEYTKDKLKSEAVFVTDWPASDMKFYHKAQDKNPKFAERIDLLFRGLEITTGSMRENNHKKLKEQLIKKAKGDPKNPGFKYLLMAMEFGMPPHGGFGMGLERLTEKLIGLQNIKEATFFPRDMQRLAP